MIEYEAPRSISPSPASTPHHPSSSQGHSLSGFPSGGNLAGSTAASGASVGSAGSSAAPVLVPTSAPQGASVGGYASPAVIATPTRAPAPASAQPTPVNLHASVNLLDMDDHAHSPQPTSAPQQQQARAPSVALVECAGRFTPVLFQQLWGRLPEAFAGHVCTLSRRPTATAELETALRTQKVGMCVV